MTDQRVQVLVVEDDPATRKVYKELLGAWGFVPRTAHNGLEALEEIRRAKPKIVLSDLEMPGMSGYELLAIVRRLYPEIRAVAMSGAHSGNEIPRGVTADAFHPKGSGSCSRLREIFSRMEDEPRQAAHAIRSDARPALSTPGSGLLQR